MSGDFADETEDDSKNKGLKEETSNVYGNGHTSLSQMSLMRFRVIDSHM